MAGFKKHFSSKLILLVFFVSAFLGIDRPVKATVIEITVDAAKLTIVLLDGTIELVTQGGEVLTLEGGWKGGVSGEKLQAKAVNDLAECKDRLLGLKSLLETVLQGSSVPQLEGHTDAVLAKATFEPVGKIVRAGGTDEGIRLFSPLETEIKNRLTAIVDSLSPAQPLVDCSTCGDPSCCESGSRCCLDIKACPNGCQ